MKSRREVLFTSVNEEIALDEVNRRMGQNGLPTVHEREYLMWQQTIVPMLRSNIIMSL